MKACVDPPAFLEQLRAPLTKYVAGIVRDRASTEDLVQETFLRVLRHLPRFRGRSSLKTWTYSIARNLCLDSIRAAGRSRTRLLGALDPEAWEGAADSRSPDPLGRIERDERRDRVDRALSALSPKARNILILRIYQGMSYREIARHCRVPTAGVGIRISRALEGLSKRLA
jgi:RNA polymerase sigma-70 factor (ECF subfamily)